MLFIGWTTVATRETATTLAEAIVAGRLAACVQIDGPIVSHYIWEGRKDHAEEFRLTVKFLDSQSAALSAFIEKSHPYETPEWIAVRAENVSEKYLSWAKANSSTPPL